MGICVRFCLCTMPQFKAQRLMAKLAQIPCYLLAGFPPKMPIRSTERTFFNFLKGRFLYFFCLIFSTLTNVNNLVYKNVQLNYYRIEIRVTFVSDLQ